MIKRWIGGLLVLSSFNVVAVGESLAATHPTLEQKFTGALSKYAPDALYVKAMADNQTAALVISQRELTRIFVAQDRILAVRGLDGAYLLNKDENQGEIFIKPTPLYQHQAISLFITTEQGHNYALLLVPADIPARTIQLKATTGSRLAERWEKNNNYNELMLTLITAMVNHQAPDGYVVFMPRKIKAIKVGKIWVSINQIYRGKYLRGEVLRLENRGASQAELRETQFYQVGTRALALRETVLPPRAATWLYRVMSND